MTEKERAKKYKEDVLKRFGKHLIKMRKAKGISPADLARLCETDRSDIARIEMGRANLTLTNLIRIAKAFEVSLEELMKGFDYK